MGLALWLVPSSTQASSLLNIIDLRTPHFPPHITLTSVPSHTPLPSLLASIPPSQPSIRVNFHALITGDHYFRSVYIAISPSPELSLLHKQLHERLGIQTPNTPAFPHMSVYYIDDSDAGERDRAAQELLATGIVAPHAEGIVLKDPSSPDLLTGFDGVEIWAASCDGPVETWRILHKVQLT